MNINKTLFWITLISGLIIFLIGVFLKLYNQTSNGFTAGRYGDIHQGMVTGFSGIFLGILILLLSIWTYRNYKKEKEKFDKME